MKEGEMREGRRGKVKGRIEQGEKGAVGRR
jgi:hypothetical protein